MVPARPGAPAAEEDDDDAWRRLLRPAAAPATPIARANDMHDDSEDMFDDGDAQMAAVSATLADGGGPSGSQLMRIGPAAVAELYSPPRVTTYLAAHISGPPGDLVAGSTFDLTANADGERWDFSKPSDRKRAFDRIRAEEPYLVVGSPPCTMVRSMQNLNKRKGNAE